MESGADAPLRPYLSLSKAIDQVRPGGVIAFVTSRYTMDQQSPEVRKYIAQRAELLGALRLPNNAFRANAGTEVVSDIIFLQKRDRAIEIEPDWVHVGENADGLTMNCYFVQHPEMVLGTLSRENTQYGRESFTVLPKEGVSLADQLHEAIGHIHGTYQEAALPDLGDEEAIDESIPADPNVRNFSYTVIDGTVYYRENSRMVKPHLNQTAQERMTVTLRALDSSMIGPTALRFRRILPTTCSVRSKSSMMITSCCGRRICSRSGRSSSNAASIMWTPQPMLWRYPSGNAPGLTLAIWLS